MTALDAATNGARLFSAILAAAILIWWSLSLARVIAGTAVKRFFGDVRHPGDQDRTVWWVMALAVMIFQVRWLIFTIPPTTGPRGQLTFLAQASLALALMLAVYVHQDRERANGGSAIRVRRIVFVHLGMTVVCAVAASVLR